MRLSRLFAPLLFRDEVTRAFPLVAAITLLGLILTPGAVLACQCSTHGVFYPAKEEKYYEAIFAGQVTDVALRQVDSSFPAIRKLKLKRTIRVYTVKVSTVWKGPKTSVLTIVSGTASSDCSIEFRKGEKYLIFADRHGMYWCEELEVHRCSRTMAFRDAATLLQGLESWRKGDHG